MQSVGQCLLIRAQKGSGFVEVADFKTSIFRTGFTLIWLGSAGGEYL